MLKLVFLLAMFLPAAALAQDTQQVSTATTATIRLYRPHRFEGSALKPPIYVDDVDVAHIHNGDAVEVTLSPGPHKVYSNDKSTGIELDAKAGQTYFVRVDIKAGMWKGHGQITLIDPQEGKYEFSKQKVSATRDLTANHAAASAEPAKASAEKTSSTTPEDAPAAAQSPPAQNSSAEAQTTDQPTSLGEAARKNREKKAKSQAQNQAQNQPQDQQPNQQDPPKN